MVVLYQDLHRKENPRQMLCVNTETQLCPDGPVIFAVMTVKIKHLLCKVNQINILNRNNV